MDMESAIRSKLQLARKMKQILNAFTRRTDGNIAVITAAAILPILVTIGAAIDYSRASQIKSLLRDAVDAGTLAGAALVTATKQQYFQEATVLPAFFGSPEGSTRA